MVLIMSAVGAVPGFVPHCKAQNGPDSAPASANKPSGLRFEVATVRPAPDMATVMAGMSPGHPPHVGTKIDGAMVDMGAMSLTNLISIAYSVPPNRVSGPDWMASQRFDVLARLPAGTTKEQLPELLQALLDERFKLSFHRTSKLEPAYVLLIGPKGQKLDAAIIYDPQQGENEKAGRGFGGDSGPAATVMRNGPNGTARISMSNDAVHAEFYDISTKGLADMLTAYLRGPVIDMTGLQGKYHVVLDFARSELMSSSGNASPPAAPAGDQNPALSVASDPPFATIFAAINKLGLKLESRKVSMEQLTVDHVEKLPTEN
jgi:uncharacterized protein (TIGR03435 family)